MTDKEILRLVGRNVKSARLRAGYTQECLAEMANIHSKTLGYIESGRHPFEVTTLARLIQSLKVSPNRLLDGLDQADARKMARIAKAKARRRRVTKPHP